MTVQRVYIMFKSNSHLDISQGSRVVRNKIQDLAELRWKIMKSMLDDFPELQRHVEQYLRGKRNKTPTGLADSSNRVRITAVQD